MTPEEDMVDLIAAAGTTLTLTAGTNLFEGPMRHADGTYITRPTVFVAETGAGRLEPYLGGPDADDYSSSIVRVLVVGDSQGYSAARTLIREILAAGHKAVVAGYTKIVCIQPSPLFFEDDEGRPVFSLNFSMEWKAAR